MYPFERYIVILVFFVVIFVTSKYLTKFVYDGHFTLMYMKTLKSYVKNFARPEACMAEGYLAAECIAFCLEFLKTFVPVLESANRNEDVDLDEQILEVEFIGLGEHVGDGSVKLFSFLGPLVREHIPVLLGDWRHLDIQTKDTM